MTDSLVKFQAKSDTAVQAQIEIKAAPEKVYAAWTDPDLFRTWFGPRTGGNLEIDQFDVAVDGKYDVTMVFDDGDRVKIFGAYQELDPPKKIVFTWQWKDSPTASNETLVTVDLAPTGVGTLLTLTHERFATASDRDQHQSGWDPILARLGRILAS